MVHFFFSKLYSHICNCIKQYIIIFKFSNSYIDLQHENKKLMQFMRNTYRKNDLQYLSHLVFINEKEIVCFY